MGQVLQISSLCSRTVDKQRHIKNFYDRLVKRGYSHSDLLPLLEKAATNAEAFICKSEEDKAREKRQKDEDSSSSSSKRIFLHLKYHPNDPKSSAINQFSCTRGIKFCYTNNTLLHTMIQPMLPGGGQQIG
eukprot:scaffold27669_cov72-Skeletonema_dohrnii-CCMP3373.AAC.3